jgi:subtilase family serine protease
MPLPNCSRLCSVGLAVVAMLWLASAGAAPLQADSSIRQLCQAPPLARAQCSVLIKDSGTGLIKPNAGGSTGYGPADLQDAYNIDTTLGAGRTVAVVGAYDASHAESDLAAYRTQYGLPACTSESGCFAKINQEGAASPLPGSAPSGDDWDTEYALQMDMISAVCPNCNILLVEADDDQGDGLYVSVNTAAAYAGVVAMTLPWGGPEDNTVNASETYFNHPGIAIVAAGGDVGYGVSYPASSQYTIAVGGTTLNKSASARGWTETVWNEGRLDGTGSGCSAYIAKPRFQTDAGCSRRTTNDVAAVGNPETGLAVYSQSDGGWEQVGGTTASTGIIAAIFALAGPSAFPGYPASYLYRQPNQLNDVTSGSNGSCGGSYLCTAGLGYDGPSGNGTPNGAEQFTDDTVFSDGFGG